MCCCREDLKHDNTIKYSLNFKEDDNYSGQKNEFLTDDQIDEIYLIHDEKLKTDEYCSSNEMDYKVLYELVRSMKNELKDDMVDLRAEIMNKIN